MGKVLSFDQIHSAVGNFKRSKKLVFTNGCFDILHIGHVRYLQQAQALGDLLFVGVNSDSSVKKLKGPTRPIQNENDRAEILAALSCVDYVCIFDQETPYDLIKRVEPNILVKGGDWKIEQIVGSDIVNGLGGQTMSLQFVDGKSTTSIIQKAQI
jgi:D-glycero-beta-D-manno-heptose 1-phosphate adenylyltransferase